MVQKMMVQIWSQPHLLNFEQFSNLIQIHFFLLSYPSDHNELLHKPRVVLVFAEIYCNQHCIYSSISDDSFHETALMGQAPGPITMPMC